MKNKEVQVTEFECYLMAAQMVMENMPLTNKKFNPTDVDQCVDMLQDLVLNKQLTFDWIKSVASANLSNLHCFVDCSEDGVWNYMGGLSRANHSREDFLKELKDFAAKVDAGKYTVNKRKGFGKNYFNKKAPRVSEPLTSSLNDRGI